MRKILLVFSIPLVFNISCVSNPKPKAKLSNEVSGYTTGPGSDKRARIKKALLGLDFNGRTIEVSLRTHSSQEQADEYFHKGLYWSLRNRNIAAMGYFAKAIRINPENDLYYLKLAHCLVAKTKLEFAKKAYLTSYEINSKRFEALEHLAFTEARGGNFKEAISVMKKLLSKVPKLARAYERMAIWHYYLKDYDASWEMLRKAQALNYKVSPQFLALLEEKTKDR